MPDSGRHRNRPRNRLHDRRLRGRPARAHADRRSRAGQSRTRRAARRYLQADGKPRPALPPGTRETHAACRSACPQAGSPRRAAAGSGRTARPIALETRASRRANLVRAALGGRPAFAAGPVKASQYRQASRDLAAVGCAAARCNACNARTRGLGLRPSDRQSVALGSGGRAGARLQRRAGRGGPDRAARRESCFRRAPGHHVFRGRCPRTRRALSIGIESGKRLLAIGLAWTENTRGAGAAPIIGRTTMKNPLDSLWGTVICGVILTLIRPNQKKILGIVPATDEEKNKARRVAFLASRTNTMFSIPMLYFMAAGAHSALYFG